MKTKILIQKNSLRILCTQIVLKQFVVLGILLIIINVNGETFGSSLGALEYMSHAMNEDNIEWESINPNSGWLYFAVPYPGKYQINTTGGTCRIYIHDATENGVLIDRTGVFYVGNSRTVHLNKPFFAINFFEGGCKLRKDSTITLVYTNYTNTNYSENTNNNHPIFCPYPEGCVAQQYVYSSKGTIMANSIYSIDYRYTANIGFNLIDYCNIVDENETVEIVNTLYNATHHKIISSYVHLNNFNIDNEYIIIPNNTNQIEMRYNSNSTFGAIIDDFDILRWGKDNSVNWYWNNYLFSNSDKILKNINLKELGERGFNVDNGYHQLKAIVSFTCNIEKEIIWDVEIYGDYVNYSQVNLDVVVYGMGCGRAELLDGADVFIRHPESHTSYTKFTDINGSVNFRDLIDTGEWNFEIGKTGYITEYVNTPLYLGYNFYTAYLFPQGTNSTLKVYVFDENLVPINDSNLYLGDGFDNFVIYTNGAMDKCDFECEKIDNLNIIRKIPYGCTGEYVLKVTKDGYIDEDYNIWMDGNRSYNIYLQNKSTVLTQSITGYVRSYYPDNPLINVRVEIESSSYNYNYTTFTNSTGHYVINNIPRSNINLKLFGSSIGYQDKTVYSNYFLFENKTITTRLIPKEGDITILKGVVTECNKGLPLDNIKIEVYNDSTYSFIIVPNIHTNSKGEWETRLFSNTLYFLRFSHIDGHFITKEISIEVGNSYQQEKDICLLSAFTLFSVNFRIAENNSEMPVYVDGYMKLNLVESFSEHENVSTFSKYYRIGKEGITIFLFPGIYKADVGKMQGQVIMTKEFLVDKDGLVIFYLSEKGWESNLSDWGIPVDEKSFFEFWNKWGWAIFFIISILFTLVIIKTEWKELRK